MKTRLLTSFFVIGALLAPLASQAADTDADRSSPSTFVKDSVITTKIKAKLAKEKMSSLTQIKVDTDAKGVVFLSGNAATKDEADRAVAIARDTDGVTSVKNGITVK